MSIPASSPAGPRGEGGEVTLLCVLSGTYRKAAPGALVTREAPEAAGTADALALLCFLLPGGPSLQGPWTVQLTEAVEK